MENILFAILSLIVGIVIGCGLFYAVLVNKTSKSMKNANKLIEDAKKEAEKMLAEQGIDMKKLKLAALMENQETIKRSVSKGMGVTILSKLAAEEELKNGTLLAFPLGSQGGKRMINLVYDAEYPLLPAAERFIKMIKNYKIKS